MSDRDEGDVVMSAWPGSAFEMGQAQGLFHLAVVVPDAPAELRGAHEDGQRGGLGQVGEPELHGLVLVGRPFGKAADGPELPACWLLAEWPARELEPAQFWLSNLPAHTPLTTLVRLAKLRWRMEHDYREMKQALDLAHFEGRTWNGWHHHVTLVSAAHAFCTLERMAQTPQETAPA